MTHTLILFSCVNLYHIQTVPFSKSNRKEVELNGRIFPNGVLPGEKLSLSITFINLKRYEIKKTKATLIQHRQVA